MPDRKNLSISLVGLLFSISAWAEMEIIELKHRRVDEVLPVVRPLLEAGDVASGMNYQLILRTSPGNIEQVRKILASLDVAPRRLKISVMQDVDSETAARLTEVSGNIGLGRGARVVAPGSGSDGLNVELGRGADRLKGRVLFTDAQEKGRIVQQLQVLEGKRALVHSGQAVPVRQRQVVQHPWGTQVIDSTRYQEAGSGFYVLPRVSGDLVTLEISTRDEVLAPGVGDTPATRIRRTSSVISGYMGEWMEVSGLNQQNDSESGAIAARAASRAHQQHSVLIKVEEIR